MKYTEGQIKVDCIYIFSVKAGSNSSSSSNGNSIIVIVIKVLL